MSDRERLHGVLGKLGAEESGGATRRLDGGDAGALMRAILTEVDETVLGRRLEFRAGDRRFVLDAANRRVLYAVEPVELDLSGLDDPAQAEALRAGLLAFVDGQASLSVTARPSAAAREGATMGIAAVALVKAWELDSELSQSDSVSPVLARLLGGIAPEVTAWMRLQDDEEVASNGPKAEVDALRRFFEEQAPIAIQQGDLGLSPVEGPECLFLPPAPRRDFPLLMAAEGQERLLLRLQDGAELAALRAFRAALA